VLPDFRRKGPKVPRYLPHSLTGNILACDPPSGGAVSVVATHHPSIESSVLTERHEAFLERASAQDSNGDGSAALGAFLTLRLADRAGIHVADDADAIAYQARATRDFLSSLQSTTEVIHLFEIARIADAVGHGASRHLLCAPLLAFAYWLEQELRLTEALDVVDTAHRLGEQLRTPDLVAVQLQRARILRMLGRLPEARSTYLAAGSLAEQVGDAHAVYLSRVGDAIVTRQLGNLPGSEAALREIVADASRDGDRDAEARARHDLGVALAQQENHGLAAVELFAAFTLYDRRSYKLRALSDLGESFKSMSWYRAAEDAFRLALADPATPQMRTLTMLELLDLSSLTGNRVAFESWRRTLRAARATMHPEAAVDLEIKLGVGHGRFGEFAMARRHFRAAMHHAKAHRLHAYMFRAEEQLGALDAGNDREPLAAAAREPAETDPRVGGVADRLVELRTSAAL